MKCRPLLRPVSLCRIYDNPLKGQSSVLLATRHEGDGLPTVLGYGHGDVIRGYEEQWYEGLSPWRIEERGDKVYGRGTADNKEQDCLHMAALACVLEERGELSFNPKFMIETAEENDSAGVNDIVDANKVDFAADFHLASYGPRIDASKANVNCGNRGAVKFDLVCELREGGHHSGNWGGLLANPGIILSHAIASIVSEKGQILVKDLVAATYSKLVCVALRDVANAKAGPTHPSCRNGGAKPGLSSSEKSLRMEHIRGFMFKVGNPANPVNAVPPRAWAHCQIRFVLDLKEESLQDIIQKYLNENGRYGDRPRCA